MHDQSNLFHNYPSLHHFPTKQTRTLPSSRKACLRRFRGAELVRNGFLARRTNIHISKFSQVRPNFIENCTYRILIFAQLVTRKHRLYVTNRCQLLLCPFHSWVSTCFHISNRPLPFHLHLHEISKFLDSETQFLVNKCRQSGLRYGNQRSPHS